MSKMGNYILGIEEDVFAIDGLEEQVSNSETVTELSDWVIEKLGTTTHFDKSIVKEVVNEMCRGLLMRNEANLGISISGIMGPCSDNTDKKIGTIWILYQKFI